jgi:large subunit ribosomal protein L25
MKVFLREKNKKSEAYRKEGKIPGILYGPEIESTPIYALAKEISKLVEEHEGGLFEVELEDKKYQGILREVQYHPLTNQIIHFDIYLPSLEKEIETTIHLEFIGKAPAEMKGGLLSFNLKEIEISALPQDIPEKIEVDISSLEEIGQSIYVKDLKIPSKIKILLDENLPVVTVIEEAVEEVEETKAVETSQTTTTNE